VITLDQIFMNQLYELHFATHFAGVTSELLFRSVTHWVYMVEYVC